VAKETTKQETPTPPELRNPTGKGGFADNPQNRSDGGWKKENTISYQYHRFLNMTPKELEEWVSTPKSERTVAMDIAYERVRAARKSLPDVREITDRTEGKAPQFIGLDSADSVKKTLVEFISATDPADGQDTDTAGV
jgi:hypothetical protein